MREIFKSKSFGIFGGLALVFVIYSILVMVFIRPVTTCDLKNILMVKHIFLFLPLSLVVRVTDLVSIPFYILFFTVLLGVCIRLRKFYTYLIFLGFFLLTDMSIDLIKQVFKRDRPDVLLQRIAETGYSFPSGHTTVCFFLGLVCIYLVKKWCENTFIRCISYTIITIGMVAIPLTRVWLGVHYPSDILGGIIFGSMWAWLVIAIIGRFELKN